MAAPIHPRGLLAGSIALIRRKAHEPALDPKYSDALLLSYLQEQMRDLLQDLYSSADTPPWATFTITPTVGKSLYMLPPNIQELVLVRAIDTTTGLEKWRYCPKDRRSFFGPGVQLEGTRFLRVIPYPLDTEAFQIEYIPEMVPMHQSVSPIWTLNDDLGVQQAKNLTGGLVSEVYLEQTATTWWLGDFDQRDNAYVGAILRVLGTVTDKSPTVPVYHYFPVQERQVQTYDVVTRKATIEPQLDFDPLNVTDKAILIPAIDVGPNGRTYLIYEVVPNVDPAVFECAAYMVAMQLCTENERNNLLALLKPQVERKRAKLFAGWTSRATMTPKQVDTERTDEWDDNTI